MKQRLSLVAAFALAALPLAAPAQTPAPMMSPGPRPCGHMKPWPRPSMSPAMMAKIQTARAQAKTAAYAALSGPHRAAVEAIVAQVNSGKITDLHVATDKIDAVLTYNEAKAVFAAAHTAMMQVHGPHMRGPGGPMGGGPPGGGPMAGGPPGGGAMPKHGCDMAMGGSPAPMPMTSGMPAPMASGPAHAWRGHPPMARHGWHHPMMMPDAGRVLLLLAVSPAISMKMMHGMHGPMDGHGPMMHGGMRGPGPMMPSPTPSP
jgi:hypothetical protein